MKDLFRNLIWPAAAGSVAWSFFTVAITEDLLKIDVWARLAVLFLLAIYLAADWSRMESLGDVKSKYWVADAFLLSAAVTFAIATQFGKPWIELPLFLMFLVAVLGHVAGAWELTAGVDWKERLLLAGANTIGLLVLAASYWFFASSYPWNLSATMLLVLVVWGCLRFGGILTSGGRSAHAEGGDDSVRSKVAEYPIDATQSAELIKHLSAEIETHTKMIFDWRSRAAFYWLVGPFVAIGSVVIVTKQVPTFYNLDRTGRGAGIVACLCFIGMALLGARMEAHMWDQCNRWRETILLACSGTALKLKDEDFMERQRVQTAYVIAHILLLAAFLSTLVLISRSPVMRSDVATAGSSLATATPSPVQSVATPAAR